jgi:beta-N-acetylhexosaminidase
MKKGKKLLAVLAAAALLAGCTERKQTSSTVKPMETTPAPSAEEKAAAMVSHMDLTTKIEQMMMPAIRQWNGSDFTEVDESARKLLSEHHFGGIILFAENLQNTEQTVKLTQGIQEAITSSSEVPAFLGIDQEGGWISRLSQGTSMPGNMALAAGGSSDDIHDSAYIMGEELRALGFNLDFAPDMDVNSNPANPIIGVRSFSDDPQTVAQDGQAYLDGLNDAGIVGCLKHFPGHGDTSTDSHTGLPVVNKTKAELEKTELLPFAETVKSGKAQMIMSAHIRFPQVEKEPFKSSDGSDSTLPATLSKTMLTDILRDEMGYQGVIVSDSLQMDAIRNNFTPKQSANLAINAGVNLLLMPVVLENEDASDAVNDYIADIQLLVQEGSLDEEKINESVRKILTLKYEMGLMEESFDHTDAMVNAAKNTVGSAEHHEAEREITDRTVTVLQNNGVLPFTDTAGKKITFIASNDSECNAFRYGFERLRKEGLIGQDTSLNVINTQYGNNYGAALAAVPDSSLIICASYCGTGEDLNDTKTREIPNSLSLIASAKQAGIPVVMVSCGIPYDTGFFRDADAVLAVYNPNGIAGLDASGNPSGMYAPNLPAGLDIIFGKVSPTGKLPVNVPVIEHGVVKNETAFARGTGLTW